MNRLRPKIALIISACLLGMNYVATAAIAVAPCPPSICCGAPMHQADMLNFALPVQKCCDECKDLLCGLLNNPLQDVKPIKPLPDIGYSNTSYALQAQPAAISSGHQLPFRLRQLAAFEVLSSPVPFYIKHLALIF